jgi:phage shock protein A
MTFDQCQTCIRLSKFYDDCVASIERLKDLTRMAENSNDQEKAKGFLETAASLESEAAELLTALTEHRQKSHADITH